MQALSKLSWPADGWGWVGKYPLVDFPVALARCTFLFPVLYLTQYIFIHALLHPSFAVCLCLQWELALMLFLQFLPSCLEGYLPAQPLFLLSFNYCCCTSEAQGHAGESQSDKVS